MDNHLFHVNSNTNNVGGISLGARKTTFNPAYDGRDSIHNTRVQNGGKPGTAVHSASILLKKTRYQFISSSCHTSQRLSTGWLGGSYQEKCACAQRPGSPFICFTYYSNALSNCSIH